MAMQVLFAAWSFENTATVLLSKTAIVSRGEFVSLLGAAFLRGQRAVTCGVWGGCVRRVPTRTLPRGRGLVSQTCFTGAWGKRNLGFVARLSDGLQEVEVRRSISVLTVETEADSSLVQSVSEVGDLSN